MSNGSKIAAGAAAALLMLPVLIAVAAGGAVSAILGSGGAHASASCTIAGAPTDGVTGYEPDQITNAATIAAVGKQMQVPEQGIVIAIATAMQESQLRNLDYGDRDSLGLFQQRPSQGWGTPAQITDPTYAATEFYRHLLAVLGWQHMTLNDAAQTVQRSGTPDAYAQHELPARALAATVGGATCTTPPIPQNNADWIREERPRVCPQVTHSAAESANWRLVSTICEDISPMRDQGCPSRTPPKCTLAASG